MNLALDCNDYEIFCKKLDYLDDLDEDEDLDENLDDDLDENDSSNK